MEYEEGDIVLCTVETISKTNVFVTMEDRTQGNIVMSEIAPGRIRNVRDFVVPKKKIVCKVLRILPSGGVDLSLRRVSQKETKEVLDGHKKEQTYEKILKTILGPDAEKIISNIKSSSTIYEFLEEAKISDKTQKELEKLAGKDNANRILEIIKSQKKKKTEIKKEFKLSTIIPDGLEKIKKILSGFQEQAKIKYLAGGRYSLEIESEDLKKADSLTRNILEQIEELAKKEKIEFSTKEKI